MSELFLTGFVKICGITTPADAVMVAEAGASAVGLILAQSPRQISASRARHVADAVRGTIMTTVVVRAMDDDVIVRAVAEVMPDVVQVHGPLSRALREALSSRGLLIVKALSVGSEEFATFSDDAVDAVLIDGPSPGSGAVHSWRDLATRQFRVPIIAAGGLTPTNVHDTIVFTHAHGVDTSSGVESAPGVKDPTLVRSFVETARRTYAQQGDT